MDTEYLLHKNTVTWITCSSNVEQVKHNCRLCTLFSCKANPWKLSH